MPLRLSQIYAYGHSMLAWVSKNFAYARDWVKNCGSMPPSNQEDFEDPFADPDTQESNVANLNDLVSLNSDITALEYVN